MSLLHGYEGMLVRLARVCRDSGCQGLQWEEDLVELLRRQSRLLSRCSGHSRHRGIIRCIESRMPGVLLLRLGRSDGLSMYPTLDHGQRFVYTKRATPVNVGDLVLVTISRATVSGRMTRKRLLIKRVGALGSEVSGPTMDADHSPGVVDDVEVPVGHVYLVSDNSDGLTSADLGTVALGDVVGKVVRVVPVIGTSS